MKEFICSCCHTERDDEDVHVHHRVVYLQRKDGTTLEEAEAEALATYRTYNPFVDDASCVCEDLEYAKANLWITG